MIPDAAPIEWQATAGGQIDSDPHGDVNLGLRWRDFTLALRTDAPELRWDPTWEHGRAWVDLRGHGFAGAMLISPWEDGGPDRASALRLATAGGEAGGVRYGRWGLYGGARASADALFFGPMATTEVEIPSNRALISAELVGGLYRESVQVWARGGLTVETGVGLSEQGAAELHWLPGWGLGPVALAPRVELWAGWGNDQDFLTRTRLGGLNPWVVPLAGAAWAEMWVEDYAVARLGPTVGLGEAGEGRGGFRLSPFADLATFDGEQALGLGVGLRAWRGRLFVDVSDGTSPTLERQDGVSHNSLWFSLGADWGHGRTPASDRPPGPPAVSWPGR